MSNPGALAFLKTILPSEGYKVSVRLTEGKQPSQKFFTSIEELAQSILTDDGLGNTVYHACASFKTPDNRKGENALGARSLWLDIDAGEGKPYRDAQDAGEALLHFVGNTDLPRPLLVGSGTGVHGYWPLTTLLPTDRWLDYATGLKQLCHDSGFIVDRTRTADIASILRTPGTHNRKHGSVLVQCGELVGPYDLGLFQRLVAGGAGHRDRPRVPARRQQVDRFTAAAIGVNHVEAFASRIADQCGQVAVFRDQQGRIAEPHWYAALGVLGFCADGDALAQEWSSGHDTYNPGETSQKLSRARNLTGATTCAHFESINPEICKRCPHRGQITSPISLGREHGNAHTVLADSINGDISRNTLEDVGKQRNDGNSIAADTLHHVAKPNPSATLPEIPSPFLWSNTGQLLMAMETTKGKELNVVVSENPIYLESVQTGEVSEGRYALSFRQLLPLKGWIDLQIDAERFFGPGGISALAGKGANIRERDAFRTFVVHSVDAYHRAKMTSTAYDQCGWKEDGGHLNFLLGKQLYTPTGIRTVTGSPEVEYRARFLRPQAGGSVANWAAATKLFAGPGAEPLAFAILAGFASTLMYFHGLGEGGTILSLVSRSSAMGKTSTVDAIASIWGQPDGTKMIISDTKVGKGLLQASLKHVSIIFDEAEYTDAQALKEFVMTFSTGRDKLRGTQDGGLKQGQSWQTIMIAAGNKSMAESLAFAGGSDAQAYRVMELQAGVGEGIGKNEADALVAQMKKNAGWAGDAFLRYLVQPDVVAFCQAALPRWTEEMWARTELPREYRFWIRMLGCMAVAAPIVAKLDLVAFNPQRIVDWGVGEAKRLIGVTRRDMTSVGALSEYLTEHADKLIVVNHAYKPQQMQHMEYQPRPPLIGRWEREEGRLFLLDNIFTTWLVKKGISKRGLIDDLAKLGVLLTARKLTTITSGTGLISGQSSCLAFATNHPAFSGMLAAVEEVTQPVSGAPVYLKPKGRA